MWKERPHGMDDAEELEIELFAPGFIRGRLESGDSRLARIVDQHIGVAESRCHRLSEGLDLRFAQHVAGQEGQNRLRFRISEANFRDRLGDPVHAKALASAGIGSYEELLRLYSAGPEELRAFIGDGAVLTDDRPLVEFFLSLPPNEGDISTAGLRGDVNRHRVP